jgi:hypothetical protein
MDQFAYRRRHRHGRYRARVSTGAAQARGRAFVNSGCWTGECRISWSLKGEGRSHMGHVRLSWKRRRGHHLSQEWMFAVV